MTAPLPTRGQLGALVRFGGLRGAVLGGLLVVASAVVVAGVLPHPMAPWALSVADGHLGAGRVGAAVGMYDQVAARHLSAEVREAAHRRAALVYATQLGQPAPARRHLEAVLAVTGAPVSRAALLDQLGELLMDEGLVEGAAARFEQAAEAHPSSERASDRLLRSAQVLADARRDRPAEAMYRRVGRDHPVRRGEAELGRAQIRLRKGQVERALTLFESALGATYDPDVGEVARLGRTTCLERLGDLDSALAELEEVDSLSDEILAERAGSLRSRRRPRARSER